MNGRKKKYRKKYQTTYLSHELETLKKKLPHGKELTVTVN